MTGKSIIKEILVKTAMSPSRLPGLDYALNPYRGCEHACIYCYAPAIVHRDKGKWGELVEAKINLPRILSKELGLKRKGIVGLGTVTDAYQPAEKKYEITRKCLEILKLHDFPVCIQTKSSLILRDIDLLKSFSIIEVGITLTSLDDRIREQTEPGASGVEERIRTLKELSDSGINTWVFLGPVLPYICEIEPLIDIIADAKPKYVLIDRLRLKNDIWKEVCDFIKKYDPQLLPKYKNIFQESNNYYEKLFENTLKICKEKGLKCEINIL